MQQSALHSVAVPLQLICMLFEEVINFENMYTSGKKCCKGVRWKTSTQNFESQLMRNVCTVLKQVKNNTYRSKGFHKFTLRERGKVREIQSVHITERMVQKCLCDYCLVPTFAKSFIYDNGACMKGKGTSFAVKRARKHLHNFSLNYGSEGYVLVFDIKNFFNSIDHKTLLEIAKPKFEDKRLYKLYAYFINCFEGDTGLGLGSQVSQISASIYLNKLDHYIKDVLGVKYYGRYMDDGYIFHQSKEFLAELKEKIILVLQELKLNVSIKKTQIIKLSSGFKFLKRRFVLHKNKKMVMKPHKTNILRYRRKYRKLQKKGLFEALKLLTKQFIGYLREFNYFDRYTKKEQLCMI